MLLLSCAHADSTTGETQNKERHVCQLFAPPGATPHTVFLREVVHGALNHDRRSAFICMMQGAKGSIEDSFILTCGYPY